MLKHEDNPQTQSPPAAQVRVTPEELAAAITALQIRKEGQPGTIAIGDAVEELGLDVTPEEVLAEVQARQQQAASKKRVSRGRQFILGLGLAGVLLGLTVDGNGLLHRIDGSDARQASTDMTPLSIKAAPNLTVGDASGKIETLSEVGDNQPVRCTFDNQSSTLQYYYPSSSALWTLIKHHGRVYVRGWMLNVSQKVRTEEGIDVAYHRDENFNTPITLPLDEFKVLPLVGSVGSFHAVDIHLDEHAYEKW